jgi:hypothetical protein
LHFLAAGPDRNRPTFEATNARDRFGATHFRTWRSESRNLWFLGGETTAR